METLSGRVAVVTGGASGIGRALAEAFVAEGMQVVIADVEAEVLHLAADELGVAGVVTDVSDAASVRRLADETVDRFGAVNVLCNNAGVGGGGFIEDLSLADWQWVLGVNLMGVVHGIDAFLPHLIASGDGHIVNTASLAGLVAGPGMGPYSASKFAVVAISETLRTEMALRERRVGVSVLCPGWVRTNIFTSQRNRPEALRVEGRAPLGDARGRNEEIIRIVEEQAIDPADVAGEVLDALRTDRFWVITHPHMLDAVEARHSALIDQGRRQPPVP
jgi:NAD(P)-dependent dehydrogenase (short-subunit alcohol dehydrogenase family)